MKRAIFALLLPMVMAFAASADDFSIRPFPGPGPMPTYADINFILQGTWTTNNSPAGVTKQQTTFSQIGCGGGWYGCFRVNSFDYATVLGSWNGKMVTVQAPTMTDAAGWTYFRIGTPYYNHYDMHDARVMLYRGRTYILEIDWQNNASKVEAIRQM